MSRGPHARPSDPLVVDLMVDLLGSAPLPGRRRGAHAFAALPGPAAPRQLVALGPLGGAALRRYLSGCTVRARARRSAAALVARAGAVPPSRTLSVGRGRGPVGVRLAELLGGDPQVALVVLGPPRANRKPVVAMVEPDGSPVAFVKLARDPLTAELVRRERRALEAVAPALAGVVHVPVPLGGGTWAEREVSVTAPLPVGACSTPPRGAVLELVGHVQQTGRLGAPVAADLADLPLTGPLAALGPLVARLRAARADVALGAWHGDLHAGNVAWADDQQVIAWDWERWEQGVPLGMDLLHHDLLSWVRSGTSLRGAADRVLVEAPAILAPLGLASGAADVAATEYLVRLAWRYSRDGQTEAGARTGDVEGWLVPALLGSTTGR